MTGRGSGDDVLAAVRTRLAATGETPTAASVAQALRTLPGVRTDTEALRVVTALRADLSGAGPLQHLLLDPDVTDVLVQRGGEVWIDRGDGPERSELRLPGEDAVRRLAVRLVAGAGRRLDTAQPWADATLPDGHRVHAVIPPVAVDGTCLSLRALRPARHDLVSMTAAGSLPGSLRRWLEVVVEARLTAVVTGGTGSGKTTLLGALLGAVDPRERIVVVEDATELAPVHPQVVRLQSRPANVEGAGAVPLRDLVRQALRMRPDRLVLGEVRGPEVVDLLVAFNTGHDGGLSTVHANASSELPARLEALGVLAGLPREAIHSLAVAALQVVIHCARTPTGRRVVEVAVVVAERDRLTVVPALTAEALGVRRGGGLPLLRDLVEARGVTPP